MRVQLEPAYVIHARHYRDTSQLLDVFTATYGRVSLVAKGVRRTAKGSSKGAILQPFIPLLLSFSGRAELKSLNACEVAGEITILRSERLFSALYLNELLVRLLQSLDPHPTLFSAYASTISVLGSDQPLDMILRRFEFTLLDELGYGFDLTVQGDSGEPVLPGGWYQYHPDQGLVGHGGSRDGEYPVFSGADLLAIAAGNPGVEARNACKRLLRHALAGHLGDRPLRSRELFRGQRKESPQGRTEVC